jgi:polyphosphate kinase 2 (PPK2 family)
MLHISLEEQRQRLQDRINRPEKQWKFRMGDLEDRALWTDYQTAYHDVLTKTSTPNAPWFVIPADKKWYRDFAVLTILTTVLDGLKMTFPTQPDINGLIIE